MNPLVQAKCSLLNFHLAGDLLFSPYPALSLLFHIEGTESMRQIESLFTHIWQLQRPQPAFH
jgi:hypothetical protein